MGVGGRRWYKTVENRSRRTTYRGELLIHAGLEFDPYGFQFLWERGLYGRLPDDLTRGAIIGLAEVVACVRNHDSDWAFKAHWHWVLRRASEFKNPIPARGALGVFAPEVSTRAIGQARRHAIRHRRRK